MVIGPIGLRLYLAQGIGIHYMVYISSYLLFLLAFTLAFRAQDAD